MVITRAPATLANQADKRKKKPLTPEEQAAQVKETPMSSINVGGKDFVVNRETAVNAAQAQAQKVKEDQLIQASNQLNSPNLQQQQQDIQGQKVLENPNATLFNKVSVTGKNLPFASDIANTSLGQAIGTSKFLQTADMSQIQQTLGLNQVDIQNLAEGQANVNKLAQTIEGLPVVGRRLRLGPVSFSLSDLVGTSPSAKVDELLSDIRKENTYLADAKAAGQILLVEQHKNTIIKLESRIKLLEIQSPELQASPDKVNAIKTEIQNIKSNNLDLNWFK